VSREWLEPAAPLGTVVRAEVEAWREWQAERNEPYPDPAVPDFDDDTPQFVEGELDGYPVDAPGIRPYYKHIVDGYDVIAESVTPVSEDREPGKPGKSGKSDE